MAFVDPTQAGQDPQDNQNPSQVDQALNPSGSQQSQQQQQNQAAPPSTSAGGAGVAAAGAGGSGTSAQAPSASKPSSSGAWTNLDSYLNANSEQATQIGQQIAQSVNDAGNKAQSSINDLGSNFSQAVQQNTVQQDSDAVNKAIQNATSLSAGQTLSSADQQAFNQQANASYGGPSDVTQFNGYNQAQQGVNTVTQKANATKTEAGRGSLLNDQFQNASQNGYTQGENNLDQLLLENSSGAQAALQPLAQQWAGLSGALNNTVAAGSTQAQQAVQTNQATAAAAKNAVSTAQKNFEDNINAGLAALQQQDQSAYSSVLAALQKGDIAGASAQAKASGIDLGLDPNQHIYSGVDQNGNPTGTQLAGYVTQGNQPTLASFATADQYAQAQALAQLAGQSASGYLSPTGLSEAGTAQTTPAFTFNSAKEASDNASNQAVYQNQIQQILGAVNSGGASDNFTWGGANAGSDLQKAADYLNNMIAWNSNGSHMANVEKAWALNQLTKLNQVQKANGFNTFATYNGPGVAYGQALPANWASQQ
jgi:hypothetical protein